MFQIKRRLQGLILVTLSVLFAVWRGNARSRILPKNFVVIYPTTNIGDMVFITPLFRAIKKHNPSAHVTVVGAPKNEQILQYNSDVDEYIHVTQSVWSLIKTLRRQKIDAGVVVSLDAISLATLFLGGVKSISCFSFSEENSSIEARPYRIISRLAHKMLYTPGKYITYQTLSLLQHFGIQDSDINKHLGYSPDAENRVIEQFKKAGISIGEKIVAIAPGAGTKIKQWPSERFGEVANFLTEKYGVAIAIIGGPGDTEESKRMITALEKEVRYCDFVGQSLDDLKATLSKVVLIIGNDSGSIYIAETFGASTMVLVGPTDEAEHPLQDETHRVVMASERGDPLLQGYVSAEDTIDQTLARSQIEAVTTDQVCLEIDDLFDKLKIEPK